MIEDHKERLILANRQMAVEREISFWLEHGADPDSVKELVAGRNKVQQQLQEVEQNMVRRWGKKFKPIGELDPRRTERIDILSNLTEIAVRTKASDSHEAMKKECEAYRAQVRADVTSEFKRVVPKIMADEFTPQGRFETRNQRALEAAQDREILARRELEIEKRCQKQIPIIVIKWIRKTHTETMAKVTELEGKFQ